MSTHSSLRAGTSAVSSLRNVLARHERVRHLMDHGLWAGRRSVFGLPKLKQAKVKARKASAKAKEEAAAQGSAATPSSASPSS